MKFYIFGTCSGTQPMIGRHHVSFAIEHLNELYWFDAGETCSYTAHLMGADILRTRAIFITHSHMDHIGGLGNLFWTLRKLDTMEHRLRGRSVELYMPEPDVGESILSMLTFTEGNFECDFNINVHQISDGVIFSKDGLKVEAFHTHHLPQKADGMWRAFGYCITDGEKKVVYSGDVGSIDDFAPLLQNCDMLLMETGHHEPVAIARELIRRKCIPEILAFIHHGRDILNDYENQYVRLYDLLGDKFRILEDATSLEI